MQLDLILNLTKNISGTSEQIFQRQILQQFYDCVINFSDTIIENNPKDNGDLLYKIMSHTNKLFIAGINDEVQYLGKLEVENAAVLLLLNQLQNDMDEYLTSPHEITDYWEDESIVHEFGYESIQVTRAILLSIIEVYISIYNFVNNSLFKKNQTDKFYNMTKASFSMDDLKDLLTHEYESPFFISEQ